MENKRAFTFIELSVIITILSVVMTSSIFVTQSITNKRKEQITIDKIEVIKNSLDNYFTLYKKYPCPADLSLDIYDYNNGASSDIKDSLECNDLLAGVKVINNDNYYGAIPTKTLNLSLNYALDGWGKKFSYVISKSSKNIAKQDFDNLSCLLDISAVKNINLHKENSKFFVNKIEKEEDCSLVSNERPQYLLLGGEGRVFFDGIDDSMQLYTEDNMFFSKEYSIFFAFEPFHKEGVFPLISYNDNGVENYFYIEDKSFFLHLGISGYNINLSQDKYKLNNGLEIFAIIGNDKQILKTLFNQNIDETSFMLDDSAGYNFGEVILGQGGGNYYKGYFYEILIFNKNLANKQIIEIRNYLYSKWLKKNLYNKLKIKRITQNSTNYLTQSTLISQDIAAIIISHGKNGHGSFNSNGKQILLNKSSKIEKQNIFAQNSDAIFYTDLKNGKLGATWNHQFDDIVRYIKLNEI